jgi:hypothetical protein
MDGISKHIRVKRREKLIARTRAIAMEMAILLGRNKREVDLH